MQSNLRIVILFAVPGLLAMASSLVPVGVAMALPASQEPGAPAAGPARQDDGERPPGVKNPPDAVGQPRAKAAAKVPPDAATQAAAQLANAPAYDLIYLRGQPEPMKVQATLTRPVTRDTLKPGRTLKLVRYRQDAAAAGGEAAVGVRVDDIARVELFEELLARAGDKAMERRDFASAFDLFARLVKMGPDWPGAKDKLYRVFFEQAEAAVGSIPPDYDTAIALCLQLRTEDLKIPGVQSLLRKACLGRAQESIKASDYATARDHVKLLLKQYPTDSDGMKMQRDLAVQAKVLVDQAKKAIDGTLEEQRAAVGLLATARQVWPDLPDLDRLILKAKRNYPVLNVAVLEQPGTFEPLGAQSLAEFQACQLVFDSLFEPDESGGQFFKGPMLRQWTQHDLGRKHRFLLERGHRWSDGKPVTAYDLENSLRLFLDPRSPNYDPERARFVGEVLVEDPFTASVELQRAHPRPLSLFNLPLLPSHLVVEPPKRGSDFSRSPVGTGPFRLGQAETPQQTKFVANPEFRSARLGQPYIKEINFHHYVKSSAAVRDMDEGKAHLMTRLDPLEVIRFSKLTGQFEVRNYLANSVYMLALNHRRAPLSHHNVRRAILMAIDRQAILTQYFQAGPGGLAHRVITGPFPTHSPAHDPKVAMQAKDDLLAKQLIEQANKAGHLPGRTLTLKYPLGDSAVEKAASQMKKDLQRVGLDVKTEAKIESDLMHEVIHQQDFDLVYWRYDHRNVLYNITPLLDPDPDQQKPDGTNFMGYQHPELAKLFSELRQEQRPLELWGIQREIHRFTAREVVFVPLWQLDNYIAYTSKLVYRASDSDGSLAANARQVPIHPLYLFRKTEGWVLEP